ncbi:MAG: protein kinase [Deltaproteobacteria bacterium]|nr:protein kinase [Deltaproteobacteria bacterium]
MRGADGLGGFHEYTPTPLPTMIGDYQLIARIGGGSMGDLYLAHKMSPYGFVHRAVIKKVKRSRADYKSLQRMLLDEARATACFHHPNLVAIYDVGEYQDGIYLAIEYVAGTDLRRVNTRLRTRKEALPFEVAVYVVGEVLRGLHHAHTVKDFEGRPLDIIHRDVNPANVLISYHGHVKLVDFGVVRMRDRIQSATEPGLVKGKYAYLAPEYIAGEPCAVQTDVYAAGVMLFELLTGRECFAGDSAYEVMWKIVNRGVPLYRLEREGVPEDLVRIVERATHTVPERRYQTAQDLANALEAWLIRSRRHATAWVLSVFFTRHGLYPDPIEEIQSGVVPLALAEQALEQGERPKRGPASESGAGAGAGAESASSSALASVSASGPASASEPQLIFESPVDLQNPRSLSFDATPAPLLAFTKTPPDLGDDSEAPTFEGLGSKARSSLSPSSASSSASSLEWGASDGLNAGTDSAAGADALAARPWVSSATTDLPEDSTTRLQPSVTDAGSPIRDVTEPDLRPPMASDVTDHVRLRDPAEALASASGSAENGHGEASTDDMPRPTADARTDAEAGAEPGATRPDAEAGAEPGATRPDAEAEVEPGATRSDAEAGAELGATRSDAETAAGVRGTDASRSVSAFDEAVLFEEPVPYSSLRETIPSMRTPQPQNAPQPSLPDVLAPDIREVAGQRGGWASTFDEPDDRDGRPAPWSGTLESAPAIDVLAKLMDDKSSGELELRCGLIWKRVRIYEGLPMSITSNMGMELIGEHLVKARIVSRRDLDRALHASEVESGSLSDKLIEFGLIDRALLEEELGKNLGARLDEALEWRWGTFEFVKQEITPPEILPRLDFKAVLEHARTRRAESDEQAQAGAPPAPGLDLSEAGDAEGKLKEALKYAKTIADGTGKGRKDKLGSSSTKPVR